MLNINNVDKVYISCGTTKLRKSIDGLVLILQSELNLDPFEKALFVFCNRKMNKLNILHFDEGFWPVNNYRSLMKLRNIVIVSG